MTCFDPRTAARFVREPRLSPRCGAAEEPVVGFTVHRALPPLRLGAKVEAQATLLQYREAVADPVVPAVRLPAGIVHLVRAHPRRPSGRPAATRPCPLPAGPTTGPPVRSDPAESTAWVPPQRQPALGEPLGLRASRRDLVRALAAELLVLVGAGGLASLAALRWVGPLLSALPQLAPLGAAAGPGAGAAVWTLAVAGATWAAVWLGLLVMTSIRPPALAEVPGARATSRGGRQRILVAAQVAVSGVLVVAAGLLLRSAHGVASIPRGFVPEDVVVAQLHTAYSRPEGPAGCRCGACRGAPASASGCRPRSTSEPHRAGRTVTGPGAHGAPATALRRRAAVARGWNRGHSSRRLAKTPMNSGVWAVFVLSLP